MWSQGINFDTNKLSEIASRHRIKRIALFGSILGSNFTENSDVDFLIEFYPDARVSLISIGDIEQELENVIGRRVDLRTPQDLSQYFLREVVENARTLYAA